MLYHVVRADPAGEMALYVDECAGEPRRGKMVLFGGAAFYHVVRRVKDGFDFRGGIAKARVQHFGRAATLSGGERVYARKRRRGECAEQSVVVHSKYDEIVRHPDSGGFAHAQKLERADVVAAENRGCLREAFRPAAKGRRVRYAVGAFVAEEHVGDRLFAVIYGEAVFGRSVLDGFPERFAAGVGESQRREAAVCEIRESVPAEI